MKETMGKGTMPENTNWIGSNSMRVRTAVRLLCVALVLVLISGIGASVLQTDFGNVKVSDFKIPTGNGQWISGTLYCPKSASADNKVPLVVTCHGYLNNSKMQDINGIELSRRGIAVIAYDAYYHGDSSAAALPMMDSVAAEGIGMVPLVEYAYNELDYVDTDRIGVLGHSMGGMAVWCTLMYYGGQYAQAMAAAALPDSDGGETVTEAEAYAAEALNKVKAGMPMGFIQFSTEETFQLIHANVGIDYAKYDEGGYSLSGGNGDLSGNCAEALAAINSVLPEGEKTDHAVIGKYYGNAAEGTLRVVYNPSEIHPGMHFSSTSASYVVDFFEQSFNMDAGMSSSNQIWFLKELFNMLGVVGALLAIIPLAVLLLEIPIFRSLKGSAPAPAAGFKTPKEKLLFWGGWLFSWLISGISFFPVSKLDAVFFPSQTAFGSSGWFAQPSTNFIMLWAVFNGIVGLILFMVTRKMAMNRDGRAAAMAGIRIGLQSLVKTLVLAVCVFVGFYVLVFASEYFFNTDFRFWVLGICRFTADKLLVMAQYLPFYFIYYLSISITENLVFRVRGQKERLNVLLCGLANVLGIVIINGAQYVKLFSTGTALWGDDRLYPMVALPLIVLLFVAAYINRSLFKATGKVWLGAMVNTLIMLMIGVANTATLGIL